MRRKKTSASLIESKHRRRGPGEGTIFQRPSDGRWCAIIDLGWTVGRRQRKYLYGSTHRIVASKLTAELEKLRKNLPVNTERQTFGQFLERWLRDCVKPSTRVRTHESYSAQVNSHIEPELGHIQLTKLAPQHVQAFITMKLASGLSAKTVRYLHSIIKMALRQACKWEILARNVGELVDAPRARKFEVQPITAAEAWAFLDAIRGERLEVFFTVALAIGLRRGEALGLRWKDVDLDGRRLRITGSL